MNKFILTIGIAIVANIAFATPANDSLRTCFTKIQATDATVQTLLRENNSLKSEVSTLNSTVTVQSKEIDSLKLVIAETGNSISAIADSLNINTLTTREQIKTNSDSLNATIANKSKTGMWLFIAIAIVLVVIAFVFGKQIAKRDNEVASLSAKADKLNEEIVAHMSKEMTDMQNIAKQISSLASTPVADSDSEQKLIIQDGL